VTSIGECPNYVFDPKAGRRNLRHPLSSIRRSLRPGGLFLFNVVTLARIPPGGYRRHFVEGRDWAILVETSGGFPLPDGISAFCAGKL
jgi:hypothetical protein